MFVDCMTGMVRDVTMTRANLNDCHWWWVYTGKVENSLRLRIYSGQVTWRKYESATLTADWHGCLPAD